MESGFDTPPVSERRSSSGSLHVKRSLRLAAGTGAVAVAAIVGLSVTSADAQDIGELESRISSAQSDAETLAAEIEAGGEQLAIVRSQASAAAAREAELSSILAAGEEREAQLQAEVDEARVNLVQARDRLRRALAALSNRLIAIYQGQTIDETALLLDSDGFDDLTTRADFLNRIQDADRELAARVRELRAAVRERLAAVAEARDAQAAHNAEVATARDQIAAVRARAEAQAATLDQARAEQAAALTDLRSQVDAWTAQVQEAEAASAAEAQETVSEWVGDYTIPSAVVMCESGGNYGALNPSSGAGGAYQILPSTWRLYGGSGLPHQASAAEQDRIAAMIWADSGGSAWVCAG